jgi:hypothetical protein
MEGVRGGEGMKGWREEGMKGGREEGMKGIADCRLQTANCKVRRAGGVGRVWARIVLWWTLRGVRRGLARLEVRMLRAGLPRSVRRQVWRNLMKDRFSAVPYLLEDE